ncbi:hypothetical protein BN1058_00751 [Paraliobacillus sp. PM-2]|uniref:hypothetical protein n=1 Tax=Paraliobacillus sp. PM-2 TaxID=1462524 RepID=UPI00061BE23B|nr:hypothetical protein [Paraliobacillus sp. PM-2]CQR46490.1 hypothetical protein BN1058_00751 [Paraliobacillus sp. PM-2]
MALSNELDFNELNKKIQQQEQTIAQLVSIIATSNRRLDELEKKQIIMERSVSSSCSTSSYFA